MFNVQNRSIETISNAVVLIGFDSVRDLAVSISIVEEVLKGNRHARVGQLMAHAFHAAALAAGGKDNGGPGLRPHYHEHYYGAFVLDPDGNNIEAVCHLPG